MIENQSVTFREGSNQSIGIPSLHQLLSILETLSPLDIDFPEIEDPISQDENFGGIS